MKKKNESDDDLRIVKIDYHCHLSLVSVLLYIVSISSLPFMESLCLNSSFYFLFLFFSFLA